MSNSLGGFLIYSHFSSITKVRNLTNKVRTNCCNAREAIIGFKFQRTNVEPFGKINKP